MNPQTSWSCSLANLEHPSIPRYVEHFTIETEEGPSFYLVQELAPGRSLAQHAAEGWRPNEAEVKRIAFEILDVLRYVHARNPSVIHRDLKPQNILLESGGKVWLVDFGAVRDTSVTQTGGSTIVGTYGYMAPEQLHGSAMPASDLFGLGSTVLFLLTGRSPSELPHRELKIDFRSRVTATPAFASWIERMVEPAPERRFASAHLAFVALRDGISKPKVRQSRTRLAVLIGLLAVLSVGAFPLMRALRAKVGPIPTSSKLASGLPARPVAKRFADTRYSFGVSAHFSAVTSVAFTADSTGLLTASVDKTVKLWDAKTGKPIRAFPGHTSRVSALAVTPNGRYLVTAGDTTVKIWELATSALVLSIPADASQVTSVAVSPDGSMLASAGFDGTAKTWSLPGGTALQKFPHAPGKARLLTVAFSPDGNVLGTGGDDKDAKLWDVATGRLTIALSGHTGAIDALAFAPDGQELATVSDDHSAKIWRTAGGAPMCTLAFHTDEVWSTAFSSDGGTLATGGKDGNVALWNPITCTLRESFAVGMTLGVAFSRDGSRLASGQGDGLARVWTFLSASHSVIPEAVTDDSADTIPTTGSPEEILTFRGNVIAIAAEGAGAKLDEAERLLKEALAKNARYAPAYAGLARIEQKRAYVSGKDYKPEGLAKGLALVDKALAISPKLVIALVRRARIYDVMKDPGRAGQVIAEAEKLEPESVDVALFMAELAVESGDFVGAEAHARKVLAHTKNRHLASLAYGALEDVYRERSDYSGMDQVQQTRIALEPESAWLKGNYAHFLIRRGEYDKAIEMGQAALRQMNYGAAHGALADAFSENGNELLWDRGDRAAAKEAFDHAIIADPNRTGAYYGLGAYFQQRKDLDQAKQSYKKVLAIEPENAQAKEALRAL